MVDNNISNSPQSIEYVIKNYTEDEYTTLKSGKRRET